MEKIRFMSEEMQETDFYVLEQTKVNGVSYILVTDSEEDDAECLILKDTSAEEDKESVYEIVDVYKRQPSSADCACSVLYRRNHIYFISGRC